MTDSVAAEEHVNGQLAYNQGRVPLWRRWESAVPARFFFKATRQFHDQITDLFDFVSPTAAAMWNLRWQVQGFSAATGGLNHGELSSRFVTGSGIHGVNLVAAYVDKSWEEQTAQLAKFTLVDLLALYEAWTVEMKRVGNTSRDLKFMTGVTAAQADSTSATDHSSLMDAVFRSSLSNGRKYSEPYLSGLFSCVDFFRETRNVIIHDGAQANAKVIKAYAAFLPNANRASLGMREVPRHTVPTAGARVVPELRGVIGFSDVLIRIAATVDAMLSGTVAAEVELRREWIGRYKPKPIVLRTEQAARHRQVERLVMGAGFPRPAGSSLSQLDQWLSKQSLVF